MCVYTGMCVCEVDGAHMPVCMYVHKVVYVCVNVRGLCNWLMLSSSLVMQKGHMSKRTCVCIALWAPLPRLSSGVDPGGSVSLQSLYNVCGPAELDMLYESTSNKIACRQTVSP